MCIVYLQICIIVSTLYLFRVALHEVRCKIHLDRQIMTGVGDMPSDLAIIFDESMHVLKCPLIPRLIGHEHDAKEARAVRKAARRGGGFTDIRTRRDHGTVETYRMFCDIASANTIACRGSKREKC
jgi:hypothetical protein